jgi:uncharacterized membrane protein YcjF (UPF0283 family)
VSESEQDLIRIRVDRDDLTRRKDAAIAERDAVIRERTEIRGALDTLGAALGMVGIVGIPAPYDLVKAVFAYQEWITARTVIACVVSAIAGAGLMWSVVLL